MPVASTTMKVLVLVKAAPVLTRDLDETMCVAGIRLETEPVEWVRLHPVPFRDLNDDSKFKEYEVVTVDVTSPRGSSAGDVEPAARHHRPRRRVGNRRRLAAAQRAR